MGYRIRYEVRRGNRWKWLSMGICTGILLCCFTALWPVWQGVVAGEGLYDALARYVGGMILGPH